MQSERMTGLEIVSAVRRSLNAGGPRIIMQGIVPTLCRDVPFSGVEMGNGSPSLHFVAMILFNNWVFSPDILSWV